MAKRDFATKMIATDPLAVGTKVYDVKGNVIGTVGEKPETIGSIVRRASQQARERGEPPVIAPAMGPPPAAGPEPPTTIGAAVRAASAAARRKSKPETQE
jgi:hypothetical protein